jgi:uncharacterized membrane protein
MASRKGMKQRTEVKSDLLNFSLELDEDKVGRLASAVRCRGCSGGGHGDSRGGTGEGGSSSDETEHCGM